MTEQTLYDRLGGVFAIAAVVDHFSERSSETRWSASGRRTPSSGNGTRITSAGCRA